MRMSGVGKMTVEVEPDATTQRHSLAVASARKVKQKRHELRQAHVSRFKTRTSTLSIGVRKVHRAVVKRKKGAALA